MCAIFSSSDYERLRYLYQQNLGRGDFAYGFAFVTAQSVGIKKGPNVSLTPLDIPKFSEYLYFLGHTQAPTSSIREFQLKTSHPFYYDNIYVAHNGVLTNEQQLKKSIPTEFKGYFNEVDSSAIPVLISLALPFSDTFEKAVCSVLSKLQGTYSLWIIYDNPETGIPLIYFARSGSTLFMNQTTREISSVKLPDISEEVPEGVLFQVCHRSIEQVDVFKANSPFLTL